MDGAQQGGGVLTGLGIIGLLVGVLLIGVSFMAGKDAKDPRCDGEAMSRGDTCFSSRSGAQGYDERASDAEAASTWMLRIGGVLALGGVAALVVGGVSPSRDD